jgi:hypothetical protein
MCRTFVGRDCVPHAIRLQAFLESSATGGAAGGNETLVEGDAFEGAAEPPASPPWIEDGHAGSIEVAAIQRGYR